jgi:hypothetical protein
MISQQQQQKQTNTDAISIFEACNIIMQKITHTFYVHGMHCKSCSLVIERELSDLSYVNSVIINLNKHTVTVTGDSCLT